MQTDTSRSLPLYEQARETAVQAARLAGELIRSIAGTVHPDDVRDKGVHDIVTDTDEEAQNLIIKTIRDRFPDHRILAEEELIASPTESENSDFQWIIDPIDGTTNFTRGIPPYAVSIALAHGNHLVLGVVYDVAHDDMYSAISGAGLTVNGSQACVSKTPDLSEALITTGFPYRAFAHVDLYLTILKQFMERARGVRRPGSASVDLAWVARGRFDGFYETGLKPWDVAAGIVLVREAGGRISDYRGNPDPAFDHQIVASNGLVHDEMLEVLKPMQDTLD